MWTTSGRTRRPSHHRRATDTGQARAYAGHLHPLPLVVSRRMGTVCRRAPAASNSAAMGLDDGNTTSQPHPSACSWRTILNRA